MSSESSKSCLIILDGWGIGKQPERSAIDQAKKPYFDQLWKTYPHATLTTHGLSVGLPEGQMGNSEVGHLNIGAGRVVYQELARINKAISDESFFSNATLNETMDFAVANGSKLHLMGLLSNGGVHSHIEHLKALCQLAHQKGIREVLIHGFTDGRDVDPKSGKDFVSEILNFLEDKNNIHLASLCGRYYAMDRDNRWERIQLAYNMLVKGIGDSSEDFEDTIESNYRDGITDEFLKPIINPKIDGKINEGDAVIFFNFRTDRPRELTEVLTQSPKIEYGMSPLSLYFTTMTKYDDQFKDIHIVFEKDNLNETLGEVISQHGLKQTRIAETEKYPHVTFFFSGGREKPFSLENRILIPSPKVATYDEKPSMSAVELTVALMDNIHNTGPDFICLNYANTDMVGHTGVFEAVVQAVETVDMQMSKLIPVLIDAGYHILIIADHGNADYMINDDGSPNTAHTMNPVPCILVSSGSNFSLNNGSLCDIAPTILELMDISKPPSMTGISLIQR